MWQCFKALREKDIIGPRMPAFAELLKTNPETTRYQSLQNIVFGCRNYCRNNLPHSQYAGFTQDVRIQASHILETHYLTVDIPYVRRLPLSFSALLSRFRIRYVG